jgi:Family of unknown function (DUF6515)
MMRGRRRGERPKRPGFAVQYEGQAMPAHGRNVSLRCRNRDDTVGVLNARHTAHHCDGPVNASATMKLNIALSTATLAAFACGSALGEDRQDHRRHEPEFARAPQMHLDQRYHHDHYYPPRGYVMPALPGGSISVAFGGGHYFFHGGVWFRPAGSRFVVVVPPVGVVVPLLPPAYVTLWIGGAPYYYANGVYYAAAPGLGYTVVAPPPGAESAQPAPAAPVAKAAPEPIIYPRSGQSAAQTEADRQECNRWATTQANAMADAAVFQRAVAACMDGRGYTVR